MIWLLWNHSSNCWSFEFVPPPFVIKIDFHATLFLMQSRHTNSAHDCNFFMLLWKSIFKCTLIFSYAHITPWSSYESYDIGSARKSPIVKIMSCTCTCHCGTLPIRQQSGRPIFLSCIARNNSPSHCWKGTYLYASVCPAQQHGRMLY